MTWLLGAGYVGSFGKYHGKQSRYAFFLPNPYNIQKNLLPLSMSRTSALTRESETTFERINGSVLAILPAIGNLDNFHVNRVIGNKRLPLVVYICVQPMLYPYAIGVGRVVLSSLVNRESRPANSRLG